MYFWHLFRKSGDMDAWSLDMVSYPGDSGTWVVDPADFSIVAIIVARCDDLGVTYALPAANVFEDIIQNIGSKSKFMLGDKRAFLTQALKQGRNELVCELLLSPAMNINLLYNNVLRVASEGGHEKAVKLLLEKGADVNASNEDALQTAAAQGNEKTVQLLLEHGADANAFNGDMLRFAATRGHEKVV
ncbi:ankyrin repeat domain-containing protein [Aspergillus foveolatus]|uniref:ankyrin repeat domain-containing protein n=1 Tax=Aspergillus foveolatus TaxID=210207 RepID=UPI003CCD46DB